GWKEDMILSYRSNTVGQLCALDYLTRIGALTHLPLRVGGHSKGGNLAIYAAARCDSALQDRLLRVWSNDGPGFRDDVRTLEGYQRIQKKCVSIVPATSIIGTLLESDCERRVVRSSASGLVQHDGFSWECGPLDFLPASPTRKGAYLEKTLDNWVSRQDDATLRSLVDSLFSLFEATGEQTFHSMTIKKRRTAELMVSALRALPREKQRELLTATGRLVQSTGASARMMLEKSPSSGE
ncbi:MAG: DUF2974 domain-containing protein, partial [Oscillospiraceae bacterium]|nr:DUF2974 domain-containing protein [Oscillospiraceae bacterium]